jgi:hypothetical protein
MGRELIALETIEVASPCTVSWDSMQGDERVRFCGQCNLHVYNLSGMDREEAEALVSRREGRLCVRLLKRSDGTVLTQDCPVGLRALRAKVWKTLAAAASLAFALLWGAPKADGAPAPLPRRAKPSQASAPKACPPAPRVVVKELMGDVAFVPVPRPQPAPPPPAPAPKK